ATLEFARHSGFIPLMPQRPLPPRCICAELPPSATSARLIREAATTPRISYVRRKMENAARGSSSTDDAAVSDLVEDRHPLRRLRGVVRIGREQLCRLGVLRARLLDVAAHLERSGEVVE